MMEREVVIPEIVVESEEHALAPTSGVAIEQAKTRRLELLVDGAKFLAFIGAWVVTCQAVCS